MELLWRDDSEMNQRGAGGKSDLNVVTFQVNDTKPPHVVDFEARRSKSLVCQWWIQVSKSRVMIRRSESSKISITYESFKISITYVNCTSILTY